MLFQILGIINQSWPLQTMIYLLKNRIIYRSLLSSPTFSFTSSTNQHIERNKSILALQIINTIKDSPLHYHSDKSCPSLRGKILERIDSYQTDVSHQPDNQKITLAVKQALRKYFQDGVWVPIDMCSQSINEENKTYTQVRSLNQDVEIYVDEDNMDQKLRFRKLKLCPTYFVTGQIFRRILKLHQIRFLTGQYGIGKTHSLILYNLLSEIIFRYRHKYHPKEKISDLNSGIFSQIIKAFYWCVNPTQPYHDSATLNTIIKRQFYELKGNQQFGGDIMECKSFSSIDRLLLIGLQIKTVLLMDQVSQLAAMLSEKINYNIQVLKYTKSIIEDQSNLYSQEQKQHAKKRWTSLPLLPSDHIFQNPAKYTHSLANLILPQTLTLTSELKQKKQLTIKLHTKYFKYKFILHQMMSQTHFSRIFYMSQLDIQRHLLNQIELLGSTKQSYIHSRIRTIQYPLYLYGDLLISDTAEFIMFHLKNKWMAILDRNLSQQENQLLDSARQQIIKHLREGQCYFFLPFNINSTISNLKITTYQQFQAAASKGQLHLNVRNLIQQFQKQSAAQMKSKLNDFIQQPLPTKELQNMKYKLLYQLWEQSQRVINYFIDATQIQQPLHSQQEVEKQFEEQLPQFKIQLTDSAKTLQSIIPYKLFGFSSESGKLQCFINPTVFHQAIYSQRRKLYGGILAIREPALYYTLSSLTSKGVVFESALIDFLINGISTLVIKLPLKPIWNLYMFEIRPFVGGFLPIPSRKNQTSLNYAFLNSFAKTIEALMKNNKYIYGMPNNLLLLPLKKEFHSKQEEILLQKITLDDLQKYFTRGNKGIDFVICSITNYNKIKVIEVNIFSTTINDKKEIVEKIQSFYEEMTNFNDQYDSIKINGQLFEVNLNYIVLTRDTAAKINCKNLITQRITDFKSQTENKSTKEQKEQRQKMIRNMNDFIVQDFGNSCKVITNQKNQSVKQVEHTISVIDITKDVELKCKNQLNIQLEMKLLKKIQPKLNIVVDQTQI